MKIYIIVGLDGHRIIKICALNALLIWFKKKVRSTMVEPPIFNKHQDKGWCKISKIDRQTFSKIPSSEQSDKQK